MNKRYLCSSLNFLFFFGGFFFYFAGNSVMNGWICRFECVSLYNQTVWGSFYQAESIYAFKNAIKTTEDSHFVQIYIALFQPKKLKK
jgi:hypothetical protein